MVFFWPWKSEDSSPASFEKTLSTLSQKIATTQLKLDKVRTNSRRVKVLWTLYLSFAYLVYAIVLILVVGWHNLGAWEWTFMSGGPVIIYVARTLTNSYFSLRIDSLETRLKDYKSERSTTIQKLKDATKYDSTLELLEKYGEERPKRRRKPSHHGGEEDDGQQKKNEKRPGRQSLGVTPAGRTNLPPPPTANIQRPHTSAGTPISQHFHGPFPPPPLQGSPAHFQPTEEFAPNAGELPQIPYTLYDAGPPRWYDRILDLMLGEDETAPKNRIVLICKKCRLVNGQAPPGTKTLSEMGQWKCMSCGTMNGEIDEGRKIMRAVLGGTDGTEDRDSDASASSDGVKIKKLDMQDSDDGEEKNEVKEVSQPNKTVGKERKKSQMIP